MALHPDNRTKESSAIPLLGQLALRARPFDGNLVHQRLRRRRCLRSRLSLQSLMSPNARYSWHEKSGRLRIMVLAEIKPGEEIFVSYLMGRHGYGSTRAERQARLSLRFRCACSLCNAMRILSRGAMLAVRSSPSYTTQSPHPRTPILSRRCASLSAR
ncbi:hypothetical protein BDZ89DRAFT_83013 [Hymenopellis radicata]|nr:hypothetical protein BDZ89DRAFT_83013 [Hymenopellis radicata]